MRALPATATALAVLGLAACEGPPGSRATTPPPSCGNPAPGEGCLFHFGDADNEITDDGAALTLLVTAASAPADVTVERRDRAGWATVTSAQLGAGAARLVTLHDPDGGNLDVHVEGDRSAITGLRLRSTAPVAAVLWNADPRFGRARSTSATRLLPSHELGLRYRAMTLSDPGEFGEPGRAPNGTASILIVGTVDGTRGRVTRPTDPADVTSAPTTVDFAVGEGQIAQFEKQANLVDLAGALIEADHPIAVFSGVTCAADQRLLFGGTPVCDQVGEQLAPESTWGTAFVVPALPPRAEACEDRLGVPFPTRIRIVASAPDTHLAFDVPPTDFSPDQNGAPAEATLALAGQSFEALTVTGFFVLASAPVEVAAFMGCEPAMVMVPAVERWLPDARLPAAGLVRESAVVIRKVGQPTTLGGVALPAADFQALGGGFESASVTLPACGLGDFVAPPDDLGRCVRQLGGGPSAAFVTATDLLSSYAFTSPSR